MPSPANKERRKKKRRWGDADPTATVTTSTTATTSTSSLPPKTASATGGAVDAKAKALALQSSIRARLAALKASKANSSTPASSSTKAKKQKADNSNTDNRPVKKAKVYDLDLSITAPQLKKKEYDKGKKPKEKKKVNPYLAHLVVPQQQQPKGEEQQASQDQNDTGGEGGDEILDNRLKGGKNRMIKNRLASKKINFIEPGTYIEKAKKKHLSNLNAIQSGYRSGRKKGTYIEATTIASVHDGNDDNRVTDGSGSKDDYYGSNENQDARTLAPRVDAIYTSIDGTTTSGAGGSTGSTKDTNGVVPIPIPLVMEWWDLPLLSKQLRKEVVAKESELVMKNTKQRLYNAFQGKDKEKNTTSNESKDNGKVKSSTAGNKDGKQSELQALTQKCYITASITNSKTYKLIQHPKPVIPPSLQNQAAKPKPVLHLTKKELKKQRKLRRAEKQREIQDLQTVGLLPKPEPKLTLSNYMRVLGTQAVLDPSTMEKKVQEQIQARLMKHEQMNLERKEKAKGLRTLKKQQEAKEKSSGGTGNSQDPSVSIALFLVQDMSHRYHRTKVDLNAQQWYITGGVLECESNPKLALVIAEGDAKAIKKYIRLMTVRMKWKGENFADGHEDDQNGDGNGDEVMDDANGESEEPKQQKFNSKNSCELVWTGMSPKRMFKSFIFQSCPTSDHARKVLEAKGVAHFWDQVLVHASGTGESFNFKLG